MYIEDNSTKENERYTSQSVRQSTFFTTSHNITIHSTKFTLDKTSGFGLDTKF
jgi:hypothetical protein